MESLFLAQVDDILIVGVANVVVLEPNLELVFALDVSQDDLTGSSVFSLLLKNVVSPGDSKKLVNFLVIKKVPREDGS